MNFCGIKKSLESVDRYQKTLFSLVRLKIIDVKLCSVDFNEDSFFVVWDSVLDKRNAKKISYDGACLWTIEANPSELGGYLKLAMQEDGSLIASGMLHDYVIENSTGKILGTKGISKLESKPQLTGASGTTFNITVLKHSIFHFNKLIFKSDEAPIACVAFGNDYMIVVIDSWKSRDNVLRVNFNGNVQWRIQPNPLNNSEYQGIHIFEDGIYTIGVSDHRFTLDPETGLVSNLVFTK